MQIVLLLLLWAFMVLVTVPLSEIEPSLLLCRDYFGVRALIAGLVSFFVAGLVFRNLILIRRVLIVVFGNPKL